MNRLAMARPDPLVAPVTAATLPAREPPWALVFDIMLPLNENVRDRNRRYGARQRPPAGTRSAYLHWCAIVVARRNHSGRTIMKTRAAILFGVHQDWQVEEI